MDIIGVAGEVLNLGESLLGKKPKPLLVSVYDMQAMIARLSNAERQELARLASAFDWYTGSLETSAGKIAAELRDANKPHERALYDFVASRIYVKDQGPGAAQQLIQTAATEVSRRTDVTIMKDWMAWALVGGVIVLGVYAIRKR